jgi:hypothetical protein
VATPPVPSAWSRSYSRRMRDGLSPHFSRRGRAFQDREFLDCWIRNGGGGDAFPVPLSPGLTSLDFF